jgi:hypothetical protein
LSLLSRKTLSVTTSHPPSYLIRLLLNRTSSLERETTPKSSQIVEKHKIWKEEKVWRVKTLKTKKKTAPRNKITHVRVSSTLRETRMWILWARYHSTLFQTTILQIHSMSIKIKHNNIAKQIKRAFSPQANENNKNIKVNRKMN